MAIEKVCKVRILGFKEECPGLLEKLQEEEIIHIDSIYLKELSLQEESQLKEVKKALDILSSYQGRSVFSGVVPERVFLSKEEFKAQDFTDLKPVIEKILELYAQKEDLLSRLNKINKDIQTLQGFTWFEASLKDLQSLRFYAPLFLESTPQIEARLGEILKEKDFFTFKIAYSGKKEILCLWVEPSLLASISQLLKSQGLILKKLPQQILHSYPQYSIPQILEKLERQLEDLQKKIERATSQIKTFLGYKYRLQVFYDYLLNKSFLSFVEESLPQTSRFFIVEGWILQKHTSKFTTLMQNLSSRVFFKIEPPSNKGPVCLRNPKYIEPFQVIVDMYGAPHPSTVDCTIFLAPFFFLFVGMCISDAGYGLVLSLVSFFLLRRKWTEGAKRFLKLLMYLGLSTSVVGLFLGSFLGLNLPFKVMDIVKSPFQFLLFSLFLGFLQIILGLVLKVYIDLKNKRPQIAVSGLSWIGLLTTLPLFFIFKIAFLKILIFVFVAGVLFFSSSRKNIFLRVLKGLYELYGITRYFSDILSYSRLLALGMATGMIAMVVNILARLAFHIPGVGIIVAGLILVGGHIFNILINLMSGFIHSARLQFVEFFSKFYQLGGRFFEPLRFKTRFSLVESRR